MTDITRITVEEMMVEIAQTVARRSTCSRRAAVGVVFANETNKVVATGYNGSPTSSPHCDEVGCLLDSDNHCVRAVHAEINAIIQCAQHGISIYGLTVYCTHSPCPRCATALVQTGVAQVMYLKKYHDFEISKEIFNTAGIPMTKVGEIPWT